MTGFIRDLGHTSLIEIGSKGIVAVACEAVGNTADLVVEAPPFLNDDDGGPVTTGFRQITLRAAAIGA